MFSDNIICRNDYLYTKLNWNSGNFKMNIESVVNCVVSEIAMAITGCYSNEGVSK